MEPDDIEFNYSSNVAEAFQEEKDSRRESRAIEIQVTRMNFRHRMQSRNVFHLIIHSVLVIRENSVGDTLSLSQMI